MARAVPKASRKSSSSPKAGASERNNAVTLKRIAAQIYEAHEISKSRTESILADAIDVITKSLKKGERIRLSGLGIFQVKKRAARMGRNPSTGEPVKIKAGKKVTFRPLKELKEAI